MKVSLKMIKNMDMVFKNGPMDLDMRVNGSREKQQV